MGLCSEIPRDEWSTVNLQAVRKYIWNETICFNPENVHSSSIHLMDLLEETAKKGFRSLGEQLSSEDRDRICRDVMRNKNHGITNYISSFHLGAKLYAVTNKHRQNIQAKMDVGARSGLRRRDH